MPLLTAATGWYNSTYGIQLNPETQALSLIGSQEGLGHLLMAVADPGDGILMCEVAYPSYFGAGGPGQLGGVETLTCGVLRLHACILRLKGVRSQTGKQTACCVTATVQVFPGSDTRQCDSSCRSGPGRTWQVFSVVP